MNRVAILTGAVTITTIVYYILTNQFTIKVLVPLGIIFSAIILNILSKSTKSKPLRRSRLSILINENVITQVSKVLMWIAFFTSIAILFPSIFDYKITETITVKKLIIAVTVLIGTYIVSKAASNYIIATERKDKTIIIKMRVMHYLVVLVAFLVSLKYLGLGTAFTNLLLAGSITSIIIGLAAQKTIGNFIAGVILLMDKPFQIGDYIEVQGVKGFVTDIQFMSTIIKTYDEKIIRIPNEVILTERVTNYKKNKVIKITQKIGISYDSDIENAKKSILEILDDEEFILMYPKPFVGVEEYADNAIILIYWFYVPFDEWYTVSKRVMERIKKKFDENGIKIPYPQLVIHGGEPLKIDNVFIRENNQ